MVIGLKRAGWSIRQIAADTHLGASTVHRLWRRWLEQGNVAIYWNAGATRVTSERVDRRILRQAVAAPQATCTAILQHVQDTLDHSISTRTISRRLVANGLHSCRPLRRLPLTPPNRRQRLEWCRARSTWMTEWHRVVFSDEPRFCLSSDSRRVRVWRRRGERSNPAAIVERPTVRQRGIMVWGAIAYDSRSPLLRIQGTMTAQRYVDDVLRPVTLPYLQGVPNALYQQDNARPHTARISQQALQDVQMLPWPPYSPDLSPIEHVWDIIGRRLHALPQPRSEDELWQMVEREWRAIPQDAIRTLIDSLPRRVAACIARMPGHRKWRQFKQTDAFTRSMVIGLKRAGWSIRQIAADTHLGASTVHRLWRRWLEQGNVAIYRNAGATRVASARVDRRILRQAVAAPQTTCTAILQHVQDTLDHSISTRTISRRLVANGLHSCRPLRRLPLTPPNRRQRLEWCRARSTWMTEWHRVVFSDESRFCLSSDSRRVRVWRRRGERSNPAAIVERPTVRQRGIMVWGAIAYDSRSPLLRIQGTMTAQRYVDDVLRPVTLPYLQGVPNALYQQDNARPHTARISQQALQDVQMLPWLPYSPDLSPIEHVWDIIGRRLHALPQPRSEDELWQMVEREWRAIPQDAIRTLIDSLPRRVAACIAVRAMVTGDSSCCKLHPLPLFQLLLLIRHCPIWLESILSSHLPGSTYRLEHILYQNGFYEIRLLGSCVGCGADIMEKGKFPQYKDVDGVRVAEIFSSEAVSSALAYVPLDEDMFVVTFPKCGTTWTQAIVLLILNKGKPFKNIGEFFKRSPFLEMCGAEAVAMMPRPGVLKLHLTYEQTPQNSKAKYIYVVRNPKDTCVSFYHHTKGWGLYGFTGSFSDFFDIFYKGENDFGEYFEHVMSWYKHRDDPNVLFILYEDLKKDTKGMVMKIAKFLGPEWEKLLIDEPQVLEDVLKYSSINEMKQMVKAQDLVAASQSEENVPQGLRHIASQMANVGAGSLMKDFEFVRKGVVGDWKNHFTEEQAKKLDDKTREGWALYGFTGSFSDFFDIFYKGENDFGEYFEHVMSWYKHRDDPNVLFILYEDLKKDTKGMVMKIAKFLGPEWEKLLIDEPQVLEDVLKYSSINEMKQMVKAQDLVAASQSEENVPQGLRHIASQMANVGADSVMKDFEFVRKGVVGDWKNHFTEEQAKKLDDKTRELASVSAMSSFEQRSNIKFFVKLKKYFTETIALMNEAYEDEKLSRTQVYFWYKRFKDGRKSIADDSRSGRPLMSTTDRNIGRVVLSNRPVIREVFSIIGRTYSSGSFQLVSRTTPSPSPQRRNLPSAMRPVPHSDILPVPQPPENVIFSDDDSDKLERGIIYRRNSFL
ncbi:hypothetical protein LAZ67_4004069, partial [Cordylochernes scorpioides]